jgi:glutamate N-acetyltransferase/amino-acid N-acetyltransferase
VASGGVALDLSEDEVEQLAQAVAVPEVELEVTVPGEGGETEVFFSDLGHDYVSINSEYTS